MRSTLFYRYLYATLKEKCVRRFVAAGNSLQLLWAVLAVSALAFPASADDLVNGGYVEGEIAVAQEIDTWTFDGVSGERITLNVTDASNSVFAPWVRIYKPDGTLLTQISAYEVAHINSFLLENTGEFTVTVQDADLYYSGGFDDIGGYRIYFVKPPVSEHGALVNGSFVEETIEYGDIDTWQFSGEPGDIVALQITDESGSDFAPFVQIYTPSGELLSGNWSYNVTRFNRLELPEAGSYTVVVQDADQYYSGGYNDVGDYRIYFVKPPVNEHGYLLNGGYVEGTIEYGDMDTWQFEGEAGEEISLTITDESGSEFAPAIQIFSPSGDFVTGNSDYNVTRINRLTLPESGTFTVVIFDADLYYSGNFDDTGDYRIYLIKPPVNEHGSLINGSFVEETIEYGDIDTWQFDGESGNIVSLQITDESDSDFAPWIQIYTPSGEFLSGNWSYGVTRFNRLELPESGSYTVVVQDANQYYSNGYDDTGDYRIYFVAAPSYEHGPLVNGGYVEGTIDYGDMDTWQFDGVAGEEISLQVTDESGSEFAPAVQIFSPSGDFVAGHSEYGVTRLNRINLTESGTYTVVIFDADLYYSGNHDDTGDYRIYFVKPFVSEHGSLINGSFVEETIEYGDIDTWHFDGEPGEIVSLQITDESDDEFAPLVQIYTPSGIFLSANWAYGVNRFNRLELTESGSYTVVVQDADQYYSGDYDDAGDYRIYFVKPPADEHGALINGGYVEGMIDYGDMDIWQFDGVAGEEVSLHVTDESDNEFAPAIQIFSPSGDFIIGSAEYGVTRINRLAITESGTYTVIIFDADLYYSGNHDDTGEYRIYMVKPPVSELGALVSGGYVEDIIDFGDLDTWHFEAASGDTIDIDIFDMDDVALAPFGQLYDPDGLFLSGFWAYDTASLNNYPLLKTGTYTLVVQDIAQYYSPTYEDTGPYRIGFNLEPGEPEPVPPSASIYTPGSVYRFDTITLDGSGSTDPDGAPLPLTYEWAIISMPAGSDLAPDALEDVDGEIATIIPDVSGEYVFSLTVDDGLFTDTTEATVTVMNRAPVAIAGDDSEMATGGLVSLDGSDSYDPESDPLTYSWSFVDVPAGSSADIAAPEAVITSFEADVAGIYVIALVVGDGETNSVADTVTVTVIDENIAPVALSSAPLEALVGNTVMLYGYDSYDPDNGPAPLSYQWTFGSIPSDSDLTNADITDSSADTASFIPDVEGNFTVWLTVSDGELSDSVAATTSVGALPVCSLSADAGADITIDLGNVASLNGSDSEFTEACTELTFSWQFVSVPAGSVLDSSDIAGSASVEASFIPDIDGTFVLRLILENGELSSADNVTATVETNASPVAIAGEDQTLEAESTVLLDGSASYDPDNAPAPLTYLWQVISQPTGSNIAITTPASPVAGFFALLPGDYVLSLTVSDGETSDTDEITITIEAEEEPLQCDVNGDNVVSNTDIMSIFARRNTSATGPDDPADLNGDGVINVLDARGCVLQCTFTNCAVQPPQ